MRRHSSQEQVKQARQIAKDHNMFIVQKNERYFVYRVLPGSRNVCIGHCGNPATLFNKVSKAAMTEEANSCHA